MKKYLGIFVVALGMILHTDAEERIYNNIGAVSADVFNQVLLGEQGRLEVETIEDRGVVLNDVKWYKDYVSVDIIITSPIYGDMFIPDEHFRYMAITAHINNVELMYLLAVIQIDNLKDENPSLNPDFKKARLEISERIYWIRRRHALGFDKRGLKEAYKDSQSAFFYH